MRESLPNFFGFEAVGVLMYNFEHNCFFTDPDTSKDEKKSAKSSNSGSDDEMEGDNMSQGSISDGASGGRRNSLRKKKTERPINYHKEAMKNEKLTEEEKQSRIRDIHQKKFMNFPTNSGISGAVFKSKELYFSNNASKETKFVEEIDNQSVCTDVKNFMIGPVFGS
mgnify:CR=1 FL=1